MDSFIDTLETLKGPYQLNWKFEINSIPNEHHDAFFNCLLAMQIYPVKKKSSWAVMIYSTKHLNFVINVLFENDRYSEYEGDFGIKKWNFHDNSWMDIFFMKIALCP